jgi:hypothetical protein
MGEAVVEMRVMGEWWLESYFALSALEDRLSVKRRASQRLLTLR